MSKVVTFGCRLNKFESQIIDDILKEKGIDDTIVINSCAVTNEAERQVKQTIRKLHRKYPEKKIVVAGCSAQLNPNAYEKMPETDLVLGNNEKMDSKNYGDYSKKVLVSSMESTNSRVDPKYITYFSDQARAFVQVQNGCNHSCTFCATTIARGASQSVPIEHIISQVKILVNNGYNEIVLTGIDLSDYGKDLPESPSLGDMIKRLLTMVPNLARLRLSSIDVAEIDECLLDIIKNESRLMPHIHVSLQSGDNMILKRMKRRHSREQVIEFSDNILSSRPEIVIGADIITGFPTETEEMFQNTYSLISEANITYLHVFPFSPKDNTPAARMPQVSKDIRKQRAEMVRSLQSELLYKLHSSMIHSKQQVIIESGNTARAENFSIMKLKNDYSNKLKQIITVEVLNAVLGENPIAEEIIGN